MRKSWDGFTWLKIEKVLFVRMLLAFIVSLGLLSLSTSAEERNREVGIVLVAIGEVNRNMMDRLKDDLSKVFNKRVSVEKGMPEPLYAYNKKRNQYLSTAILSEMMGQKEYAPYEKILGIVDHDLFVPGLNFVFGEAGPKAAVISLTRLRQTFYRLHEDQDLFHRRVLTEAVHELGHTYGLGHCGDPRCVMFFSNSLSDTDRKGPEFCPRCRKNIHPNSSA
jgi:archaemetzincin